MSPFGVCEVWNRGFPGEHRQQEVADRTVVAPDVDVKALAVADDDRPPVGRTTDLPAQRRADRHHPPRQQPAGLGDTGKSVLSPSMITARRIERVSWRAP